LRQFWRDIGTGAKYLIVFTAVLFVLGGVFFGYRYVFGPAYVDQQRREFEQSATHRRAVVQELTANCAEAAKTKDPETKKAIMTVIAERASLEDIDSLQMPQSVRICVDEAINQYVGSGDND